MVDTLLHIGLRAKPAPAAAWKLRAEGLNFPCHHGFEVVWTDLKAKIDCADRRSKNHPLIALEADLKFDGFSASHRYFYQFLSGFFRV